MSESPFYGPTETVFRGTEGPYRISRRSSIAVDGADGSIIVYVDTFRPYDECLATAHLLAASWDLLKAAQDILHWYETDSTEFNRDTAIEDIRRAIAKAVPYGVKRRSL